MDWEGDNGYKQLIDELSSPPTISHQSVLFISAADTNWKYKKGTSEASTPINLWRELDFVEDEEWIQGQTPIGYGDEDDNTILDDMRGSDFEFSEAYTSVYFRKKFIVERGNIPARLLLKSYIDDGAIIWINGVEVVRLYVEKNTKSFDETANDHEAIWESLSLIHI